MEENNKALSNEKEVHSQHSRHLEGRLRKAPWIQLKQKQAELNPLSLFPSLQLLLGFKKFGKDDEVIFYCRSGRRSGMAFDIAKQLGYKGVRNYSGSWLDYEAKAKGQN